VTASPFNLDEKDVIRRVRFDGYELVLWDTGRVDEYRKSVLGYRLIHPAGWVLFEGEDYCCSPCFAIDSDSSVRSLLTFLTLRPGDTDPDYFDRYSVYQLAWAENEAEALQFWASDPEEGETPPMFEEVQ
jgi:hypothetical protein